MRVTRTRLSSSVSPPGPMGQAWAQLVALLGGGAWSGAWSLGRAQPTLVPLLPAAVMWQRRAASPQARALGQPWPAIPETDPKAVFAPSSGLPRRQVAAGKVGCHGHSPRKMRAPSDPKSEESLAEPRGARAEQPRARRLPDGRCRAGTRASWPSRRKGRDHRHSDTSRDKAAKGQKATRTSHECRCSSPQEVSAERASLACSGSRPTLLLRSAAAEVSWGRRHHATRAFNGHRKHAGHGDQSSSVTQARRSPSTWGDTL